MFMERSINKGGGKDGADAAMFKQLQGSYKARIKFMKGLIKDEQDPNKKEEHQILD